MWRLFLCFLALPNLGNCVFEVVKNCTKPGPFCETCTSLVGCVQQSDGTWTKNPLAKCDAPTKCVGGVCTAKEEPFCWGTADLEFPCKKTGIFPHPFYCNKFVMCVYSASVMKAYLYECPENFRYNVKTDLCDVFLDSGECPEGVLPVPLCETAGQSDAIPEKPAMYYTCEQYSQVKKVLYPVLDLCPGAEIYEKYQCVDTSTTTVTAETTETTPTTTII